MRGKIHSILICFLFVMGLEHAAFADIPPPPPQIPGTQRQLPNPATTAIGGIFLSLAVVLVGLRLIRGRGHVARSLVGLIGALCFAMVIGLSVWSSISYKAYEDLKKNWGSNGPARRIESE